MKYIPVALFAFIVLSLLRVPFPKFISDRMWLVVNGIALYALWPKVKTAF